MQKMRILNRYGVFEYICWDYNPDKNPEAKDKAQNKLAELGIANAEVYEVAPLCFWYRTPEKESNLGLY